MSSESRVNRLNELILKKANTDPWDILRAYDDTIRKASLSEKDQLKKIVIEKLLALQVDFKRWEDAHSWFYYQHDVLEFKKLIADKLAQTAKTFDHWHSIFRKYVFCAEHTQFAILKMKELASNERELKILNRSLQYCSDLEVVKNAKKETPVSFDEWLVLYRQSIVCPDHRKDILEILLTIDVALDVLYLHYKRSKKSVQIRKYFTEKMNTIEGTLEQWCLIYIEVPETEELRSVALRKIKEKVMQ